MGIAALTAMMNDTVVLAGTHLPEDPNLATPGYCDESLVKTQVERARCDTKDAVAGGFFWITPFEKHQIDDASVDTSNPANDRQLKTGHRRAAGTWVQ